ncbi:hypothetical protein B0H19DRAFT_1252234 [Mycena capillaripes]|nr:hypothetical protein B0H19DRAFT_1252234 [Mycena capillaripes]
MNFKLQRKSSHLWFITRARIVWYAKASSKLFGLGPNASNRPTKLPQELFEAILDHLADHPDSLGACSLVCRAWVSRSRFHLFEKCLLHSKNILVFRDLLRSPRCTFLQHVRSISAWRLFWKRHDRCFDKIIADLHRLENVRTLLLSTHAKGGIEFDRYFVAGFITAFPRVTRLVLHCYHDRLPFATMLGLFPALQVLDISLYGMKPPPPGAMPPKGLHSLSLNRLTAAPILAWLHAVGHLPNVDSVKLTLVNIDKAPIVRAALQQIGGALRHLDISMTGFSETFDADLSAVFDLSLHSNLKTLIVRDRSWGYPDANRDWQIISLITRLSAPTFESLLLDLNLPIYQSFTWAALDAFLSSGSFPCLRKVVLFNFNKYLPVVNESLREVLPLLAASGVAV